MGLFDMLRRMHRSEKDARLVILGLDNAGKTTILKKVANEDITHVMPSQGFNVKSLARGRLPYLLARLLACTHSVESLWCCFLGQFKFKVWDVGGA